MKLNENTNIALPIRNLVAIVILLVNLSGCTKQETYPNKMNTIAKKLSQLKL